MYMIQFMYMKAESKICNKCEAEKPLTDFWSHPHGKFGKRPRCKDCVREQNSRYKHKPHVSRAWKLKTKFNLDVETYETMLAKQNGKCALCKKPPGIRRLAVDHDHRTGAIRGLIHWRCNTAIGLLEDSPEMCMQAAAYLKKFRRVA